MHGLEMIPFHGANEHPNNESFKNCSMATETICLSNHLLFSLSSTGDKLYDVQNPLFSPSHRNAPSRTILHSGWCPASPAAWPRVRETAGTSAGAALGKGMWMLQRATPGHENRGGLQGIPPARCWNCRQMVGMFEKAKPGFLQTHGVPQRAPPCQLLAQCVRWEQEPRPDVKKDPRGAGSPGTSAACPCSQLRTAIWLILRTTWKCLDKILLQFTRQI
ncbi:uncharacterized protein [Ciconia boyciana]|uniref:uncharacterized protein n=1 Tax=Ciconia boyciana TaxID=52775 RepID=UPI003BA24CD0